MSERRPSRVRSPLTSVLVLTASLVAAGALVAGCIIQSYGVDKPCQVNDDCDTKRCVVGTCAAVPYIIPNSSYPVVDASDGG